MFNLAAFDKSRLMLAALELVGWRYRVKIGPQQRGGCLIHGSGPRSRSFTVNTERGLWYCHKCKIGGDAVDLLCRVSHLSFAQAVYELHRQAGIPIPCHVEY